MAVATPPASRSSIDFCDVQLLTGGESSFAAFSAVTHVGGEMWMDLTSRGRDDLAVAPEARCHALLRLFVQRRCERWLRIARAIGWTMRQVHRFGFCAASWEHEVVALSTPLLVCA